MPSSSRVTHEPRDKQSFRILVIMVTRYRPLYAHPIQLFPREPCRVSFWDVTLAIDVNVC